MGSIWSQTCSIGRRPPLRGHLKTQAAVVGAGMAGVLTAYALQQAGLSVVVLEADRIAGGQTQNTTAKITSQHGLIYSRLIQSFGEETARRYAKANQDAVRAYQDLIDVQGISCDWEERCAYLYGPDVTVLQEEAEAARRLGLPASFTREVSIPIPHDGAVCFEGQAQFHPLKFLKVLADQLTIYEQSRVLTAEGDLLTTELGSVQAEHIVFACHFPFVNFPGMYFARMHQERSDVLALQGAPPVDGMFLGVGRDTFSLRTYGELLLLGGGGHRTGENTEGGRYDLLRRKAREWFPQSQETAHWSAQDCMPPDHVPYIGPYSSSHPGWYVATGFQKWGMTSSMAAATLLCDMIQGRDNPYAGLFSPSRLDPAALPGILKEGGQAVKSMVKRFFQIPAEAAKDIPAGHGGIVFLNGKKAGVYRDETGALHPVDIRCPHLGCQLEWDPDEKTWDCPCHGSRFDCLGRLISGPAQTDLDSSLRTGRRSLPPSVERSP